MFLARGGEDGRISDGEEEVGVAGGSNIVAFCGVEWSYTFASCFAWTQVLVKLYLGIIIPHALCKMLRFRLIAHSFFWRFSA